MTFIRVGGCDVYLNIDSKKKGAELEITVSIVLANLRSKQNGHIPGSRSTVDHPSLQLDEIEVNELSFHKKIY